VSKYYLETPTGDYRLDATKTIKKALRGKATSNRVEGNFDAADHYVNEPDVFTLDGVITDIKSISSGGTGIKTKDFIIELTKLKESGTPVILHYGFSVDKAHNCVIEEMSLTQNSTNGSSGYLDAFGISLSLKKIRFVSQARVVTGRDISVTGATTTKKDVSESPESVTETDEQKRDKARRDGTLKFEKSGFFGFLGL